MKDTKDYFTSNKTPPKVLKKSEVAQSRIFCVEQLELAFSNGEHRIYERLKAGGSGAVLVIPIDKDNNVLLIREFAAGTERYELALPKGLIDKGETALAAANRELKEEVGMGAKSLTSLKQVTLAPGYLSHKMTIVLAQDLYVEKLEGDEPEPIEVVPYPFNNIEDLIQHKEFTEARSIAALYLAKSYLEKQS